MQPFINAWQPTQICGDYLSDAEEVYQLEVLTGDLFGTLT